MVAIVAEETRQNEKAIDHVRREIALLRQYRTRLILDVVTGRLDVRNMQIPVTQATEGLADFESGKGVDSEETAAEEALEESADADE